MRGQCSKQLKEGLWEHYKKDGSLERKELCKQGLCEEVK